MLRVERGPKGLGGLLWLLDEIGGNDRGVPMAVRAPDPLRRLDQVAVPNSMMIRIHVYLIFNFNKNSGCYSDTRFFLLGSSVTAHWSNRRNFLHTPGHLILLATSAISPTAFSRQLMREKEEEK